MTTTEIERRINENHPESLKALAAEVQKVFAPVIDSMNVGFALMGKQFEKDQQFMERWENSLKRLADGIDANTDALQSLNQRITQIEVDQKELSAVIAALVEHLAATKTGEKDGQSQ